MWFIPLSGVLFQILEYTITQVGCTSNPPLFFIDEQLKGSVLLAGLDLICQLTFYCPPAARINSARVRRHQAVLKNSFILHLLSNEYGWKRLLFPREKKDYSTLILAHKLWCKCVILWRKSTDPYYHYAFMRNLRRQPR